MEPFLVSFSPEYLKLSLSAAEVWHVISQLSLIQSVNVHLTQRKHEHKLQKKTQDHALTNA